MKISIICAFVIAALVGCAAPQHPADKKIKVLVLTGNHSFRAGQFFKMFQDNPEITFTNSQDVKMAESYDRPDLYSYDVVVLYDVPADITDAEKARFLGLFDRGIGVVVLNHAYLSYPSWPEFGRIAGGRYIYQAQEITNGITESICKHHAKFPVTVVAGNHPVTAGLTDFTINDELYVNMDMAGNSMPLLKTGDEWVAWYRIEKNSRLVGTILGDDCYADPNFQKFVAQSIHWTAGR
jgi:uncharacterized protein